MMWPEPELRAIIRPEPEMKNRSLHSTTRHKDLSQARREALSNILAKLFVNFVSERRHVEEQRSLFCSVDNRRFSLEDIPSLPQKCQAKGLVLF
jgi:hypothetical protein